jgi:D-alanine-D-alanine ligase
MKPLRVLVLVHITLVPPDSLEGFSEKEIFTWKTEYDVVSTLRALGHEVKALGLEDEIAPLREAITGWKPDIVFNLLEELLPFPSAARCTLFQSSGSP